MYIYIVMISLIEQAFLTFDCRIITFISDIRYQHGEYLAFTLG